MIISDHNFTISQLMQCSMHRNIFLFTEVKETKAKIYLMFNAVVLHVKNFVQISNIFKLLNIHSFRLCMRTFVQSSHELLKN